MLAEAKSGAAPFTAAAAATATATATAAIMWASCGEVKVWFFFRVDRSRVRGVFFIFVNCSLINHPLSRENFSS